MTRGRPSVLHLKMAYGPAVYCGTRHQFANLATTSDDRHVTCAECLRVHDLHMSNQLHRAIVGALESEHSTEA